MPSSLSLFRIIAVGLCTCSALGAVGRMTLPLNQGWQFSRTDPAGAEKIGFDDTSWESVRLPHTARLEPLVVNDQWQGICWYRQSFTLPVEAVSQQITLHLAAAMGTAQVWVNAHLVTTHVGGYLPVVVDVTDYARPGSDNLIAVRLDNNDNPYTGPKPLKRLDFNLYGGLYREAHLTLKSPIHITDPLLADTVAGGGQFITYPQVSPVESTVRVQTAVANDTAQPAKVRLVHRLMFGDELIVETTTKPVSLEAGQVVTLTTDLAVPDAQLWSPRHPHLYDLQTTVLVADRTMDTAHTRLGIREFSFRGHTLYINGEATFLRGVNRHQEYPFIGNALSDNAQYRDARKIKEAGFDYVRLSHYPQSPAFMDACDELGLVTLDAILGWQYYLDDARFRDYCYRSATQLIRRDRNHASVLGWEVSLNETRMPVPFMAELHRITHAEFPGAAVYSAGWMDDVYDIFLQARQHRILHGYPKDLTKPYMVSEYGDWEYFSTNAGLNQDQLDSDRRVATSSRQLRAYGEARLLQQARNIQEAHNDNLTTAAYSDAYWVMFDYNRGYHDDLESSGVMDIFRLPKFACDFFASQQSPDQAPVLKIASWWTAESPLAVKVYSNCDAVELFLNGRSLGRQQPDRDPNSTQLEHPPFTFAVDAFAPGTLRAVGWRDGQPLAEDRVRTPTEATGLKLWLDESGRPAQAGCNDVLFLRIAAVDAHGTIQPTFTGAVELTVPAGIELLNVGPIVAEAGIATALIRIGDVPGRMEVVAKSAPLPPAEFSFTVQ